MIELRRDALLRSLDKSADGGHLLVVGEPGAGKSWLLKEFVSRRENGGDGVVFLRAEDYQVTSLSDLLKSIGATDFFAALRSYPGVRKFLVIDSLDSLRAEASQRAFRDLIRIVEAEVPSFTVILSIRTFDMQRSPELQELFPLRNEQPSSSLSHSARHFVVPVFSERELDEAIAQDERLRPILSSASAAAKTLLCNPFNLWLVVHLLDAGAPIDWLSAIQAEVQLLDRYWLYRIDSREDGVAKNALLSAVTARMVDSRAMSVAVRDFDASTIPDEPLNGLLSDEILSRNQTGRISYTHNILFDFAISKLLIDDQNMMAFILAAPARGIFYRPSVSYFMARLWFHDRKLFWKSAEQFFERKPGKPAVVAITAARAIFELAQTHDDLLPLFAMPPEVRLPAIVFVLRTIQALNGFGSPNRYLWMGFLISSFDYLDNQFLNEAVALIETALEGAAHSTEIKLLSLGAIQVLKWIWNKAENEPDLSEARSFANFAGARLLPIVAKNYPAIPSEAKKILTEVLGRFKNPRSSASEAFRVANNLDSVIENDPQLAGDIFVAILGHEETSEEQTQMGGAVMPLLSNRAQDFSLSYYVLSVKFKELAARDLALAAKTAARSVTAQVGRKEGETITALRAYEWAFQFLGKTMRLNSDRSDIWDHSYRDYTAVQLVDQLLYAVTSQMKSGELASEGAREILCELGGESEFAVTWKRILTFASQTPEILAIIPDLLQVPELLAAPETTAASGMAIAKAYEADVFAPKEFEAIQAAILAIPGLPLASIFRDARLVRDGLLERIPADRRGTGVVVALAERKVETASRAPEGFYQTGPGFYGPDEEDGWFNFDRPAWSPTPKIEAARGVMHYLANWGKEEKMKGLAEQLSSDPSPAVRLQITIGLALLYEKNRDLFWKIANTRMPVEKASGVLASLAQDVTHPHIARRETAAVIDWQISLLRRELAAGRNDEVLTTIAHSLTDLFVFFADANASHALEFFEKDPGAHSKELTQMAMAATFYLSEGIESDDETKRERRSRARAIWKRALSNADVIISEYFSARKRSSTEEHEQDPETLRGALRVIDSAVFQLYLLFHVNENLSRGRETLPALNDSQRKKLFHELEPIWKLLLGPIGPQHKGVLPAQTTHHLMELFRTTVSYDPTHVLQLAADMFKGFNMGYQSDQMAIGEIVRFAEVILADHKEILKEPSNAANLASILDQFVEVGWPQATQLVMKLDSAVR